MRSGNLIGFALIIVGLLIIYILRELLISVIVVVLGLAGLLLGFILVIVGFGLIFWRRGGTSYLRHGHNSILFTSLQNVIEMGC